MVIWVAVGGRGTLIGAIVGTLLVNYARTFLSEQFAEIWLFFQGALFLIVVTVLPDGIVGWLRSQNISLFNRRQQIATYPTLEEDAQVQHERENIVETENVTVSFDGFKALNQLNFSMDVGELRVVIGPNGAGKTTFLDVITGKVQPTVGRVLFKGKNLRSLPEHKIARLGIGRKFQTPRIYLNLTPRENLEITSNPNKNVFSTLFGRSNAIEKNNIKGLLETIGLTPKADIRAGLLSHGEKQRLEIGMLVAQSPDLLLVDEPVAGLTDEETYNIGELLLALAQSHSILVIEHDMEFVRQIAQKVTVLHEGSVLCEGNFEEIQNDSRVIEVYLGKQKD